MPKFELYINQIMEMCLAIEKSLDGKKFEDYLTDANLYDATHMRLQVIGEQLSKLPKNIFNQLSKQVKCDQFVKSRNIISHAYVSLNNHIVWELVTKKVPKLKKQISKILKEESKN